MKNKTPVFTYIITVLNSFFPATLLAFLGCILIMGTTRDGQSMTFIGLFGPSVLFGFIFCMIISWVYFYMIRRRKVSPRWWSNILLIVLSYLAVPAHAFIYAKTVGLNPERYNENLIVGPLALEAFLLAMVGFIWIGLRTKNPSSKTKTKNKTRLTYLKWILFPLYYYIALFTSGLLMGILLKSQFFILGSIVRSVNLLLRLPLYNAATKEFVLENFSGSKGHIIFLSNALIWGVLFWVLNRLLVKKCRRSEVDPVNV